MKITLDESKLEADIISSIQGARPDVEDAMAERFKEMTIANFGIMGPDRPHDWARLSPRYAKKVGREIATLVVSGRLMNSIHKDGNKVEVDDAEVPYATAHQYGNAKGNLPARPYFPLDEDGNCLPYSLSQVIEAGQNEIDKALK